MSDLLFNDYCSVIGVPLERKIIGLKGTLIEPVSGVAPQAFLHTTHDRMRYTVNWAVLTFAERKTIFDFYKARQGIYDTWLFKDPTEYRVAKNTIGTGDGTEKDFQLVDGVFERWDILASPAAVIYHDDVVQSSGYTIDATSSGIVTHSVAPALNVVVAAAFDYYRRCRFVSQIEDAAYTSTLTDIPPLTFEEVIVN